MEQHYLKLLAALHSEIVSEPDPNQEFERACLKYATSKLNKNQSVTDKSAAKTSYNWSDVKWPSRPLDIYQSKNDFSKTKWSTRPLFLG